MRVTWKGGRSQQELCEHTGDLRTEPLRPANREAEGEQQDHWQECVASERYARGVCVDERLQEARQGYAQEESASDLPPPPPPPPPSHVGMAHRARGITVGRSQHELCGRLATRQIVSRRIRQLEPARFVTANCPDAWTASGERRECGNECDGHGPLSPSECERVSRDGRPGWHAMNPCIFEQGDVAVHHDTRTLPHMHAELAPT